jgi:rhodanese-related sulfurtransferase
MVDFLRENPWLIISVMIGAAYLWMRYGLYLRGIKQLNADSARRLMDERQALLVDVREDSEYAAAHIPGSRHLPLSQIRRRLQELESYRQMPLVVSCRSGSRSARACIILKKHGFAEVYNLKGGIIAWARANHGGDN